MNRKEVIKKAKEILNESDNLTRELKEILEFFSNPTITLADFLGLEEGNSYKRRGEVYKIKGNHILKLKGNSKWYYVNLPLWSLLDLRQAAKTESKKYYAKIKGWELVDSSDIYWNRYDGYPNLVINNTCESKGYTIKLTKSEWNKLGINDSNADFEEVE